MYLYCFGIYRYYYLYFKRNFCQSSFCPFPSIRPAISETIISIYAMPVCFKTFLRPRLAPIIFNIHMVSFYRTISIKLLSSNSFQIGFIYKYKRPIHIFESELSILRQGRLTITEFYNEVNNTYGKDSYITKETDKKIRSILEFRNILEILFLD